MPFRPCPSVSRWRTRSLSSVSGPPTRWSCVRGWLMRLLWAYEHDFAVISPFLYESIGTLCRTNFPRDSTSLAHSSEEGPPFSGARHHMAPASRSMEPPCVAPGRDAADLSGLPPAVVETIIQARAPEPASTALGGGRSSLSVAVSRKSIMHIRDPHPERQKLRAAVGPLDSGGHHLGVPVARRVVPPEGEGSLHQEYCLLPCVGARCLFGRHLQSCGLGDTEHLRKIIQSPRWASFFPCIG